MSNTGEQKVLVRGQRSEAEKRKDYWRDGASGIKGMLGQKGKHAKVAKKQHAPYSH
jgi:hypothetical protein